MLHLRLITPPEKTDDVLRLIENTVGATHLVVLRGAARNPAGDVVTCDVAREAGDALLTELQAAGVDRTGSIAVENIDLTLSLRADKTFAVGGGGTMRSRGSRLNLCAGPAQLDELARGYRTSRNRAWMASKILLKARSMSAWSVAAK